jgi:transcriptional regulator with XRE-family HTH domain
MQKLNYKKYTSVNTFLRDYRLALAAENPKKFSQAAVAKTLKIGTPQFLSHIETGKHSPPVDVAVKLANYYRIDRKIIYELLLAERERELRSQVFKKMNA